MGRISDAFSRADSEGRAALIIYLCAGDPSLEWTPELVLEAARSGADIIELGIPFSDPTADGPTIQQASARALAAGANVTGVLDVVRRVREQSEIPILLFGYYNPILAYGEARLVDAAADAGADGFLVVDLPPEEGDAFRGALTQRELDFVPLLAPTSDQDRVEGADQSATSFIYYVSMTGVTGSKVVEFSEVAARIEALRAQVSHRVAVGFGIRNAEDVARLSSAADGVVVGSALVREIAAAETLEEARVRVAQKVQDLASGLPKK